MYKRQVRHHDFTTLTRSETLIHPTGEAAVVLTTARRLLAHVDVSDGLRLLGVGVSGFSGHAQEQLAFDEDDDDAGPVGEVSADRAAPTPESGPAHPSWRTGQDVVHDEHGAGWVWGAGRERVSVRFEGPRTQPGVVRTFGSADPALHSSDPPDWRASDDVSA